VQALVKISHLLGYFFVGDIIDKISDKMNYFYFLAAAILSFSNIFSQSQLPPQAKTFNILIIPGHNPTDGGANYKNIYERDLVAEIGAKIADTLNKESGYKVTVARDENNWNPILSDYFTSQKQQIIDWKNKLQEEDKAMLASGQKKYVADMADHSEVTADTSVRLYGMNKWANENNIDLVLNLHFNDEQRPNMNAPGDLKGFVIFVPESQMKNSGASKIAGEDIFKELKKIEPPEINYLLEDQTLIALGASGTLNAPSILIEYSYIYEKGIRTDADRENTLNQMAGQTALGIDDYAKTLDSK
jgi:N-acetylmuramoyl-L-alanine amidase